MKNARFGALFLLGAVWIVGTSSADDLVLGEASGSNESMTHASGDLVYEDETIGVEGTGTFTQTGGTNTASSTLTLGEQASGEGHYVLEDGTLDVYHTRIGSRGTGSFSLTGGIHDAGWMSLGYYSTGVGTYTLADGLLNHAYGTIGRYGTGIFVQNGGTFAAGTDLTLGEETGSIGQYSLNGGTLSGRTTVGEGGTGVFLQTGGTHNLTGKSLTVGGGTGTGQYTLETGDLVAKIESVGAGSSFTQTGGSNSTEWYTSVSGSYRLEGGTLDSRITGSGDFVIDGGTASPDHSLSIGNLTIGDAGTAAHSQNAYTTVSSNFVLGNLDGSSGSFTQGSGNVTVAGDVTFGNGANSEANYIQNADSLSITGELRLGNGSGSAATMVLSGNGISVGDAVVGHSGEGSLTLESGTATFSSLDVGYSSGGIGLYRQTGGATEVSSFAYLGYGSGSQGAILLEGGTMHFNNYLFVGKSGSGSVEQIGGTATFNKDLMLDGPYTLSGGTLDISGRIRDYYQSELIVNGGELLVGQDVEVDELTLGSGGHLAGNSGQTWEINGDFRNASLMDTLWDTGESILFINGGGAQILELPGQDLGALTGGYTNNFSWDTLSLGSSVVLTLADGNGSAGAALYVSAFEMSDADEFGTAAISSILSNFNVYYDTGRSENNWLAGGTYEFSGSGSLIPVPIPEPSTALFFGLGLGGLMAVRRHPAATV